MPQERTPQERTHECKEMTFKEYIKICTISLSHTKWSLNLINFGATIYDIKYCPYCGVKL